jgi:protein Mpv17
MKLSLSVVYIVALSLLPIDINSFAVIPSPDIVVWSQQHVLTAATSTVPKIPDLFALYQNALHTLPLQTQMITGAVLAFAGDSAAQTIDKTRQFDPKRTISFAAFDACYRAVQHILYPPMKDYFHGQFLLPAIKSFASSYTTIDPHHTQVISAAAEQALISQLVVIPLLYYPIFFLVTGMVQGLSWNQTLERGLQSFVPLMKRNLLFWIPVQFGVFGWINDDALQISILIACGFIWTIILSACAGAADQARTSTAAIDDQLAALMTPPTGDYELDTTTPACVSLDVAYATVFMSNSTGITDEQLLR